MLLSSFFKSVQLTSIWSSPLLLSLVSLCCLRLVCSCALCNLMCCRLWYTSAWTCWLCLESLANTLASTLCLPCLSTTLVSLSVRQKHTFRESNVGQSLKLWNYYESWFTGCCLELQYTCSSAHTIHHVTNHVCFFASQAIILYWLYRIPTLHMPWLQT